jgi:hypothetical protein
MSKDKPIEQKLTSTRPLKYDRAMQEAVKRAQYQPAMIAISSKVKDEKK